MNLQRVFEEEKKTVQMRNKVWGVSGLGSVGLTVRMTKNSVGCEKILDIALQHKVVRVAMGVTRLLGTSLPSKLLAPALQNLNVTIYHNAHACKHPLFEPTQTGCWPNGIQA